MQDFISRCTSLNIPAEKYGRRLIWHDEFNREKIDEEKWTFFRSMNCENRIYNNDTRHARIENSNLQLQIYREDDGKYSLPEGLATKETMLFKYGYVEMRAKIPFRHCAWPSFWMLGNTPFHNEKIGWFAEIDIFEVFSSENLLIPNLHKWGKAGHEMLTGSENDIVRAYQFKNNKRLMMSTIFTVLNGMPTRLNSLLITSVIIISLLVKTQALLQPYIPIPGDFTSRCT